MPFNSTSLCFNCPCNQIINTSDIIDGDEPLLRYVSSQNMKFHRNTGICRFIYKGIYISNIQQSVNNQFSEAKYSEFDFFNQLYFACAGN